MCTTGPSEFILADYEESEIEITLSKRNYLIKKFLDGLLLVFYTFQNSKLN